MSFKKTGLWQRAFLDKSKCDYDAEIQRLITELLEFRTNVEFLVSKISSVLPGLTVHDITHLDSLWVTADLIAGENYPLNPLEAFVFGGTVLLHDAAMCWEAFENGKIGVRDTVAWKDAFALERDKAPEAEIKELEAAADFLALRTLHADQATELAKKSWKHPDTKEPLFLINDSNLRTHLGRIIGLIASSHHWNIDTLSAKLGEQLNAPHPYPADWQIDPIKIACLLRCADAAHINQQRAPDLLYALTKRKGLSHQHWQAQNRMTGPAIVAGDATQSSITYSSTLPFEEDDESAWWIAYDAISMVDAEIHSSNNLLRNRNRESAPEFKIKSVKGANSIEDITKYLQVHGWTPCAAELHVSNIESLIRELGGEKLYGDSNKLEIVLRELLQNSRDAIVSRRFVDSGFQGEISIELRKTEDITWLIIEDNGIGMSREVLTGPLLDFGKSFWKSSLIHTEFPGLRSSAFRPIGRFGIGFYSIFMIADSVEVVSKRFDKGLDDTNSLVFKHGLTLRPIIRQGRVVEFRPSLSTQVKILLKPEVLEDYQSRLVLVILIVLIYIHRSKSIWPQLSLAYV